MQGFITNRCDTFAAKISGMYIVIAFACLQQGLHLLLLLVHQRAG